MAKSMTPVAVLRSFFGFREGDTLKEFSAELKALTPAAKAELVTLAAAALGVTVDEAK